MLAGWQESHTAGAKITFWLPDSESLEVFKGMTAKKGHTAGQRFMAVLVEIGDDDQPVQAIDTSEASVEEKQKNEHKGGPLARLAGMWCNDRRFYDFIRPIYDKNLGGDGKGHGDLNIPEERNIPEFCRHAILVLCEIDSRAELDHNQAAADIFHRRIREPFIEVVK